MCIVIDNATGSMTIPSGDWPRLSGGLMQDNALTCKQQMMFWAVCVCVCVLCVFWAGKGSSRLLCIARTQLSSQQAAACCLHGYGMGGTSGGVVSRLPNSACVAADMTAMAMH